MRNLLGTTERRTTERRLWRPLALLALWLVPAPSSAQGARRFGPLDPESLKVVAPRSAATADTITLKERERGFVVEDTLVQASLRTALICYQNGGPYVGTTVRNSILRVEPGVLALDRSYWGVRAYDMVDTLFERVEITGFGKVTPRHDEGHAIYMNVIGPLTIIGCDIHLNGGQALQLVNRPAESVLPPAPGSGTITIRGTSIRENGFNPDRGGTQVSIFGTGHDVVLDGVEIIAGRDGTPFLRNQTGGALLIEPETFRPIKGASNVWWRPKEQPAGFVMPFTQGRVQLTGVVIDHVNPNRPIVQIKGCRELLVQGCTFVRGRVDIDLPGKPGRECGLVSWKGNRGDAEVYYRGERLGLASEDFVVRG